LPTLVPGKQEEYFEQQRTSTPEGLRKSLQEGTKMALENDFRNKSTNISSPGKRMNTHSLPLAITTQKKPVENTQGAFCAQKKFKQSQAKQKPAKNIIKIIKQLHHVMQ